MSRFGLAPLKRQGVISVYPYDPVEREDIIIEVPKDLTPEIRAVLNRALNRYLKKKEKEDER